LTPTVDDMATITIDDINVDRAFRIRRPTPIDGSAAAYYGKRSAASTAKLLGEGGTGSG
jgi:hypothetical protein